MPNRVLLLPGPTVNLLIDVTIVSIPDTVGPPYYKKGEMMNTESINYKDKHFLHHLIESGMLDKMEPGTELDQIIAEFVIDMPRVKEGTNAFWPNQTMIEIMKEIYPDAIAYDYIAAPSFTTSIAHAWLTVEHFEWDYLNILHKDDQFVAQFGVNGTHFSSEKCDTIPEAICKAAIVYRSKLNDQ